MEGFLIFEGFPEVAVQQFLDITHTVVDFASYLGEGNDSFIAPCLGCSFADVHQLKKFLIVEEFVFRIALFLGDAALDFFQALDQLLELVGGKNNSVHFFAARPLVALTSANE